MNQTLAAGAVLIFGVESLSRVAMGSPPTPALDMWKHSDEELRKTVIPMLLPPATYRTPKHLQHTFDNNIRG